MEHVWWENDKKFLRNPKVILSIEKEEERNSMHIKGKGGRIITEGDKILEDMKN